MAAVNPPRWIQGGSHNAEGDREIIYAMYGGRHGVIPNGGSAATINGMIVSAQTSPNMTVRVADGNAVIKCTESGGDGMYAVRNDASFNITISAAHATNTRRDLIVARVRDAAYGVAVTSAWALEVITGTPAASPVDPAVPDNCLVLARITLPGAASTVTNAYITDLRAGYSSNGQAGFATAIGGVVPCTSTTRPTTGLYTGLLIMEIDTNIIYRYNSSATWVKMSEGSTATVGTISLSSGWVDYGGLYSSLSLTRDLQGQVVIEGLVLNNSGSPKPAISTIGTIPVNFRPSSDRLFMQSCSVGATGATRVDVTSAGLIVVHTEIAASGFVSISGITYRTYL